MNGSFEMKTQPPVCELGLVGWGRLVHPAPAAGCGPFTIPWPAPSQGLCATPTTVGRIIDWPLDANTRREVVRFLSVYF